MKALNPSSSTRIIVAVLVIVALAMVFWVALLSPKREKSSSLGKEVEQQEATLAESRGAIAAGEAARREFSKDYQQLVVLGKAVPASDETSSLFVQLNGVSHEAGVKFESLKTGSGEGSETSAPEPAPAPAESESSESSEGSEETSAAPAAAVEPTEAAAAAQPLGAQVGPAGLSVLPYDLSFKGEFFQVAGFLHGLDAMIHTANSKVAVNGRLVTVNGFALTADAKTGFPHLNANFSVTTYLVPPGQLAEAASAEPGEAEATNASSTTLE